MYNVIWSEVDSLWHVLDSKLGYEAKLIDGTLHWEDKGWVDKPRICVYSCESYSEARHHRAAQGGKFQWQRLPYVREGGRLPTEAEWEHKANHRM